MKIFSHFQRKFATAIRTRFRLFVNLRRKLLHLIPSMNCIKQDSPFNYLTLMTKLPFSIHLERVALKLEFDNKMKCISPWKRYHKKNNSPDKQIKV